MNIYKEGDKSQAICEKCGLTQTTFRYRDVPLSSGKSNVNNILVGVCDSCGMVVSTLPQEVEKIKNVINN